MAVYIGLIRAIGPITHAKMSMAALRDACAKAGFADVTTVLATGNVLFRSDLARGKALSTLQGIVAGFGLDNAVILVTPAELARTLAENPFPDATERGSEFVVFFLAEPAVGSVWIDEHRGPERFALRDKRLYADYSGGVSASPVTPAKVEKRLGVVTTFRNWNTIGKLVVAAQKLRA